MMPCLRDAPANENFPPLTEADLVRLWAGQRLPQAALVTRQGVPLRVLHPGRRSGGPGPDFRDALIAAPSGVLARGDVELHLRTSDFQAHGHHRDHRYDRVILHLVFEDHGAEETRLADGRRAPVVALAPWLRQRARQLQGWLAHPALWREPCHDALARLGRERVLAVLAELGDARFRERQAALASAIERQGPEEALYRALLAGLGYGGDGTLFEAVADALPWRRLKERLATVPAADRRELAEALLLGSAGLLPAQQGRRAGHPREEQWEDRWQEEERSLPRPAEPRTVLALVRPANHPARRLAGLARLVIRHGPDLAALQPAPPVSALIAGWSVPADGYWRQQAAPAPPARRSLGALIGRGRAIELLVNALLPWAAARSAAQGDRAGSAEAQTLFARLPRPGPYGRLAFLEGNLRAADGRPLPLDARRQQGLLALYKGECTQGGCGRCPLS